MAPEDLLKLVLLSMFVALLLGIAMLLS